ncbi:MAG TPA: thiamine pyrophosphate-requiring protein [Burkholderiaceae bacterium]|nr:thiamine pyrophosphate-requiring protein [Burkholderiaceae bacterium]
MGKTVGDHVIQRLAAWGVDRIYGYPGDGINGLMGALDRMSDKVRFVQTRHEESASFMACAHAKFTSEVGICLGTSGPGAIHLLNGLYDAKLDHAPVVAIVGQAARMAMGGHYQQEVDLLSLFKDVASEYVQMITVPEAVRHVVDRAIRIARDQRTVTCIIIPNDVQQLDAVEEPPREHNTIHSSIGHIPSRVVPHERDLIRAADILNSGQRVAMLVGAGALHATDEVIEVADLLGAGVAKALLGMAAVPDELPFVTGSIGLLGTAPSWDMMQHCDTLLMVGSNFPYSEYLPKEGQARGVQIDIDGRMLSMRYPMELGLIGDSKQTLRALIPHLRRKADRAWRERIEKGIDRWWRVLEARAMSDANPINPQRVFWELSPRLPDRCILTCDSGTSAGWYARDLKMRRGMMGSLSGGLATMGPALPYALAAKYCYPDRHVIAILGDGAMQMLGINALITLARDWRRWKDPRFTVLVLNNRDLNMVTWEQRILAGDPKFEDSQVVPDFPYAEYARMLGLNGIRVDRPEAVASAWEEALASNRPTLVEAVTDPNVPPVPPNIKASQVTSYLSALWNRDPDALATVIQSAKEYWASLVPAGKGRNDR